MAAALWRAHNRVSSERSKRSKRQESGATRMVTWARSLAAKKSLMSPTVPGKGVGGDPNRHVPALPKIPATRTSGQMSAKPRGGKK